MVSKQAAPEVFYLPGGKPEPGEDAATALRRELLEELAALEDVPMRMTVFLATLDQAPRVSAELATLAWTTGVDRLVPCLAPAVADHVVPHLVELGLLTDRPR